MEPSLCPVAGADPTGTVLLPWETLSSPLLWAWSSSQKEEV